MRSMTPQERRTPKILNGSRRARIACGSGRTPADVNLLMDRFAEAQRMMRAMRSGGGMPGLPGAGKRGKQKAQPKKAKGAKRSGNPAKAAQEAAAAKERAAAAAANPFGNPDAEPVDYEAAAANLNLPKDFSKFLK